jgi:hypothetical protein
MHDDQRKAPLSRDGEALYLACEREGCPICLVMLERMEREIDLWQYEVVSDMRNRQTLLRSKGFCARHTWQVALAPNLPTPFALAMVYRSLLPDVLEEVQRDLAQARTASTARRANFWRRLWRRKPDRQEMAEGARFFPACPFCQRQAEIERELLRELLLLLSSHDFLKQLPRTTGFCLLHLTQATRAAHSAEQRVALLECQSACLQRNLAELDELVRKHDYRFLQEPRGEEMTAWRRAAELLVGNRGVY